MKSLLLIVGLFICSFSFAQTSTTGSGNWSDVTVWSTGVVPGGATTVNVNNPLVLDQNITITTGTYSFFQNVTDPPGGTNYTLTMVTSGGVLDVISGTTTFGGAANVDNSTIFVRNGATLIVGPLTINNQSHITVESGGTLIINGDFTNNNNGIGTFSTAGLVIVNGNYSASVGSVSISGTGDFITTGTISTTGGSDVFGQTTDCGAGPCSGQNLCNAFTNTISASQILCSTGTPAGLTGNAVGGAVYSWESSTASANSGFGLASGTNNTQNYTPGALAQTTWFRRKVTKAGCTGISVAVQITILNGGGWLGTTNDWNTASNWCSNSVPTSTTDVAISTGVPNMPQITAASQCRDLIINSGASMTINGSNTLAIFGNLTANGTLTTNTSTVTLSGSSQQTLAGNPFIFNSLIINNTSGGTPQVVANTFVTVQGTLTMTLGNINLAGFNLVLGSSAGSSGTLT